MTNSILRKKAFSIASFVLLLCVAASPVQLVHAAGDTDRTFQFIQTDPCAVTLTPASQNFGSNGGTGTVNIRSTCAWTAVSNAPWITVVGPPDGSGNSTRDYTVAENTDAIQRTGTITIGDKTFTVTQDGTTCVAVFAPQTSIPAGSTLETSIGIGDLTGLGYVSYTVDLSFDPAIVSFAGIETAGTVSSGFTVGSNMVSPGNLRIAGFGTTPLSGSGELVKIRFTAIGAIGSSTELNFTNIQFNEGGCWITIGTGFIEITGRTVSGRVFYGTSPEAQGIPGITVIGNGSAVTDANGAYTLSNLGTGPMTLFPFLATPPVVNGITALDASAVLQHVLGVTTLGPNQLIAAEVSGNGSVTAFDAALIAKYAVGSPDTAFTGTWVFSPASRSYPSLPENLTGQDFAMILRGEVTGNWTLTPALAEFGRISENKAVAEAFPESSLRESSIRISSPTLVAQRGPITIPVTLGNYNGQIITAYQFDLIYDPEIMQPDVSPVDLTGTLSSSFAFAVNPTEPGRLRVAVYGVSSIPANGTLLNLRFNVIGLLKRKTALTFEALTLNEGQPSVSIANGKLTVKR